MHVLFLVISLYISYIFCDLRGNSGSRCPTYYFRCSNGQCIPTTSVCDGTIDCRDRSDETQAVCAEYALSCPPYGFRCAYGACVDKSSICDGISNCADSSDELLPQCFNLSSSLKKCKLFQFQCDSGQCIDEILLCDGNKDCIDGSDESITQCINFGCPPYGFRCAYGGCINKIKKCDGREDCSDGSDEDTELCSTNIIQQTSTTAKPTKRRWPEWNNGGCLLPGKPHNGNYEVNDCIEGDSSSKCRKVPETLVNLGVALKYSCNPGYVLSMESFSILCQHGIWDPEPPSCLKLCAGVHSYSLELECYDHGNKVNCGQPVRPGTELKTKCKNTYHPSDYSSFFNTTECLPDGTWAKKLYKCLPDCGIRNTDATPLIKGGIKVKQFEFPWHAGFYLKEGENTHYKCGGSIIHPKAVLTAAHCVYDESMKSLIDEKIIRIAVGKHWSKWDHKDDTKNVQRFGVIDINIPDRYRGKDGRYEQDIAIIHLDNLIILKSAVMPVCLDKLNNFRLSQRSDLIGTVVGSGATQTGGVVSEELKVANFQVVGFHRCLEIVNGSRYITYDKYCAGLSNGTSVQEGDSGSGMTFPMFPNGFEQHFIFGIVSLRPTQSDYIAAYTDVTVHMEWIEKVLNAIEQSLKKFIPV